MEKPKNTPTHNKQNQVVNAILADLRDDETLLWWEEAQQLMGGCILLLVILFPLGGFILWHLNNIYGCMDTSDWTTIDGLPLIRQDVCFQLPHSTAEQALTIVMVVIWVLMLIGGLFWLNSRASTTYAITNRRIIIAQLRPLSPQLTSYGKREITELTIIGKTLIINRRGAGKYTQVVALEGISNPREVKELIIETFGFEQDDFWN